MGYINKSVREVLNDISEKKVFLPEIQRSLVWTNEQIEKLFDSLFRGYPVGTMLWWKITIGRINAREEEIGLRDFILHFHERDAFTNQEIRIPLPSMDEYRHIVLDGQQRLSALAIGFLGSVARRKRWGRKREDASYPVKELYFNLAAAPLSVDPSNKNGRFFRFLEGPCEGEDHGKWYRVGEILQYHRREDLTAFLDGSDYDDNEKANIRTLYEMVRRDDSICYFEIDGGTYDEATELFLRLNSSGTPLSQSDLIFSSLVKSWPGCRKIMEVFLKKINAIGQRFKADKNFLFRTSLTLSGLPIDMRGDSFTGENAKAIKKEWNSIAKALEDVFDLLKSWGFSDESIMSYNALIPLVYFRFRNLNKNITQEDKDNMRRFFIISQLKNIFGSSTNATLASIRSNVFGAGRDVSSFRLDMFDDVKFPGGATLKIDEADIKRYIGFSKGAYTFMLLSYLCPEIQLDAATFHQDHLHPYSGFAKSKLKSLRLDPDGRGLTEDEIKEWQKKRNKLPNLQLLKSEANESKKDKPLSDWAAEGNSFSYKPANVSLDMKDFEAFYAEREKLMEKELRRIFNVPEGNENGR